MWTVRVVQLVLASLLGIGAGVAGSHAAAAATAPGPQEALHEVLPGDDLHTIAGYYYGDARQWERIWQANRDQIRNPNRLQRGTLLRIPEAGVPAEPYADFVARVRRPAMPAGSPAPAEAPPSPTGGSPVAGEGIPGTPPAPPVPAAPPVSRP